MGQGGDLFAQDAAIGLNIGGADLQEVVKARCHHMALFHLGDQDDGLVKGLQGGLARVRKAHLDKGDMGKAHALGVQEGAVAGDDAGLFQPFEAGLGRGFGKADSTGEFNNADTAIDREDAQDGVIKTIKRQVIWHALPPRFERLACICTKMREK
jgi:hypothetical protein